MKKFKPTISNKKPLTAKSVKLTVNGYTEEYENKILKEIDSLKTEEAKGNVKSFQTAEEAIAYLRRVR